MDGLDLVRMHPANDLVRGGLVTAPLAPGQPPRARATVRVLAEPGKSYAVYVKGGTRAELVLDLSAGPYRAEWIDTKSGKVARAEDFEHKGGARSLASPDYAGDIALRV